ncbi:MAG: dUTP diphosphatase [Bacilli bacterium]|jgi:dimeric dUTPase (all-alpha-NTP-PPase superfamily)
MKIELSDLFAKQKELDAHIQANHGLDYPSTRRRRLLALLVELGELANETRAFKFWSLKGPSPLEVIMDEYADGMHFFLSLGIAIGSQKTIYEITRPSRDMVEQVLTTYHLIDVLAQDFTIEHFEAAFQGYLDFSALLDVTPTQVADAYYKKLGVNYRRQTEKY